MKHVKRISEKKQKLIDRKKSSPFMVGEKITVLESVLSSYTPKDRLEKTTSATIVKVNKKSLIIEANEYRYKNQVKIKYSDVIERSMLEVGVNIIEEKIDNIRPVAFSLSSILFTLNILGDKKDTIDQFRIGGILVKELNWNPFVYDKNGNKQYYQRDFVWSLEDKQLLIDSIYNRIDCGKILVRKRSWKTLEKMVENGETDIAFYDIVDGKQRLEAVRGFIMGEYPDRYGNYFADLSYLSQNLFVEHQLFMYAEMPENTTDEEVIYQFLKMNFTGVPQSREHIEYVKQIQNKLK